MALPVALVDRREAADQVVAQPNQPVVGADDPEQQHRTAGRDRRIWVGAHRPFSSASQLS